MTPLCPHCNEPYQYKQHKYQEAHRNSCYENPENLRAEQAEQDEANAERELEAEHGALCATFVDLIAKVTTTQRNTLAIPRGLPREPGAALERQAKQNLYTFVKEHVEFKP